MKLYSVKLWKQLMKVKKTRMHSSRMRTGRSLTIYWGGSAFGPGCCLLLVLGVSAFGPGGVCFWLGGTGLVPLEQTPLPKPNALNFPLGYGPGLDPPQFPPWLWAWTRSPSISPLGVGLDQIPLIFPLGCGPGPDPPQFPP